MLAVDANVVGKLWMECIEMKTMKRRQFMKMTMATGGVAMLEGFASANVIGTEHSSEIALGKGAGHKNVLLIVSDDHGSDQLGCYGNSRIKTPNLDAMAAKGVRFTNAFAVAPSCSASRGSILTGLYPHQNGQFGHEHNWHHFSLLDWVETIPSLLKKNGYRTGLIGKLHVGSRSNLDFDYRIDAKEIMGNRDAMKIAECSGGFFNQEKDKPFFLLVGYSDPHREDQGMTQMKNVENFSGFANDKTYRGVTPVKYRPEHVHVPDYLPNIPEVREELADQYEAISRLDTGIGWVLDNLRKSGRDKDTLVIYISDNGIPFPGAKTTVYDSGTKVPMILNSPEITKGGIVNHAVISFIDLLPTILDWTGAKSPRYKLLGRSLRNILNESDDPTRNEVYCSHTFHEVTMFYPMRSLRTRRYRYILNLFPELVFPSATDLFVSRTWQGILKGKLERMGKRNTRDYLYRPKEELYDIEKDPAESVNLAADVHYSEVLNQMRGKLRQMRAETDDYWLINDNYFANSETFPRQ